MKRKIYDNLLKWKNSIDRKPLILQGARQVGKTYIVNSFGNNEYSNVIYINFERDEEIISIFSSLNPHSIIPKLANYKRKEILPKHTLIIFDEIQACPKALTSLKYFNEEANDYHIIALGSLLGVAVNRKFASFPVGKVQLMTMYPMDFEEYLIAKEELFLIEEINNCFENNIQMDNVFHEKAMQLYKEYLLIGGMPGVVSDYLNNNIFDLARNKQLEILGAYQNDMNKYNSSTDIPKTRQAYKSIGVQLGKENKKFQYRVIKSGGRAKEFENAIEWICMAGIGIQNFRIEQIMLPLEAYKSSNDFKFYMSDVGLCCAGMDIHFDDIYFDNELINNFKGGLTENYVMNQLLINGLKTYYWTSASQAEIDFIIRLKDDIIPIEVKSNDNVRSRSLSVYKQRFNPIFSVRISSKNFGYENGIKSIPLYAVFCIKN